VLQSNSQNQSLAAELLQLLYGKEMKALHSEQMLSRQYHTDDLCNMHGMV
jgi:hypothetical protein